MCELREKEMNDQETTEEWRDKSDRSWMAIRKPILFEVMGTDLKLSYVSSRCPGCERYKFQRLNIVRWRLHSETTPA